MRKKYIGIILSFVFTVVTPLALSDELPTDNKTVDDNTPVLLYDPGHGDAG